VQNMRRHKANPEFLRDAMEDVAKVTGRMETLMKRLSDLRKGSFSYQLLDLNAVVGESLDALGVAGGPVTLHTDLAVGAEVRGDAAMLRRVAENLITNAIQAMGNSGTLSVTTRRREGREGPEVELAVADTGVGMEEEFIREHLFHPFATTKRKGLGLGLYQCRRIVEAHGGDIVVDSTPGEGTCFRILLPAVIPLEDADRPPVPAVAR
jgi:signal transduction histidine kinase